MRLLGLLVSLFIILNGLAGAAFAAETQTVEQGGVAVEFAFHQQDQQGAAIVNIALRDAASGSVLQGVQPAAWMLARHSEQMADELSCEDKANQLVSGSLGLRADVDMNAYRLVTLNQDNTVAFINPLVSLKNSKLESIVQLPSTGYDWVYSARQQRLLISLREAGSVAVINTATRQLVKLIELGEGSLPTRLALDPEGQHVWVGLDGRPEVAQINIASHIESARIPVGKGLHSLVMDADTPWLFVTNSEDNSVTQIDRVRLIALAQIAVARTPVAAAWSSAAQRLVVITANAGQLQLLDPSTQQSSVTVSLAPGITVLSLFDEGRYALVANPLNDTLSLIDLAAPRVLDSLKLAIKPDQLLLKQGYAYVRGLASAQLHVLNLAQAKLGKLQNVMVPMGRQAPQAAPEAINDAASVMVAAPEGNGILMANAPDGVIYRYVEGMMAPVGSFSNYRRQARALRVLDDSLNERTAGQYQATVRMPHIGRYDVIVRNLRPAVTACFTAQVVIAAATTPLIAGPPTPHLLDVRTLPDHVLAVEFNLLANQQPVLGVNDMVVLAIQRGGQWQGRSHAQVLAKGRYQALLVGVPAAEIELLIQAPSQQVWFTQGRLGRIRWPLPAPILQVEGARDASQ